MRSALEPELVQEKLKKLKERDAQMESRLDSQPMHRKKPMYQEDEENTCSKQIKSIRCSCVLADIRDIDRLYMWMQSLQRKCPMKRGHGEIPFCLQTWTCKRASDVYVYIILFEQSSCTLGDSNLEMLMEYSSTIKWKCDPVFTITWEKQDFPSK